jgi:hypothetical protein
MAQCPLCKKNVLADSIYRRSDIDGFKYSHSIIYVHPNEPFVTEF